MVFGGKTLDLRKVTIPIYELATKEDHIAPARGVFRSAQCFGGPVRFVLAGSGHIAGVVNPAGKPKYQFWTGGPPRGRIRRVGREGEGNARLVVDRLGQVGGRPGPGQSPSPQAGRRQAETARRRAGGLCAGEGVKHALRLTLPPPGYFVLVFKPAAGEWTLPQAPRSSPAAAIGSLALIAAVGRLQRGGLRLYGGIVLARAPDAAEAGRRLRSAIAPAART